MMDELRQSLRKINAQVMFRHAVFPLESQMTSINLGGPGEEVTKADVEKSFGPEAAKHWQAARDAKRAFFEATTPQEDTPCA